MASGIVTLLTDFGTADPFVGVMKGVILGRFSSAQIVDLAHGVSAQDVAEGAFWLERSYGWFSPGTVHVAVVDPGVGSLRRPLLVTTSRHFFVAPDNGLLSYIYQDETNVEVRQIENKQYRLDSEGTTFDGRDLFAPAAAWLTRGQQPGSYGKLIQDYVKLPLAEPTWQGGILAGTIVYVDRFGNLISNLTPFHVQDVQGRTRRPAVSIRIGGMTIDGLVRSYSEGDPSAPRALINSNGQVEVFIKEGSAAGVLNVSRGGTITLA